MRARPRRLYRNFALTFAAAVLPLSTALAQQTGSIAGRVDAADTHVALTGARIGIVGTTLWATSGETGTYVIARVPTGTYTLRVTYLGRAPQSREIRVFADSTTSASFELEAVTLTPVMVRASGQAAALSRQQNAPNIKSIVASDQMGRFPDASAPEAVQRLPGVTLQRDQGEGRYVQLRGSSAATTQVTINGEEIGSPEADSRQIALDAIPVGVLAAVEISKAITPDMDADAIGGSVNLVTKRAEAGRSFTFEGSGGYAPIRESGSFLGAATYGERTADGRLGWLFSGSFGERNFGSDDIEPDYDGSELSELEIRHYTLWRRRSGATASVDFAPTDGTTFYVNGLWSQLQDKEQRRALMNGIEDGELGYAHKDRLEKLGTFNVLAGAEHRLRGGSTLSYSLGFTRSEEDTPFDREASFLQEGVTFAPSRANPDAPQANPQDGALGGTYRFDELSTGGTLTRNRDLVGAIGMSIPLPLSVTRAATIRFGAKIRDKKKDQTIDAFELEPDGTDIVLGSDVGHAFDNDHFAPGRYAMPWTTSEGDIYGFQSRFANILSQPETDVEAQTEAFELRERVTAAYAMAELDLTPRLFLLPGVRFEHTMLDSDGHEFDADAETLAPASADNSYSNIFPMIHARYALGGSTNLRAAFTTSIFRPNFMDLVPYRIVDGEDIDEGNPKLDPTTARNFDLMVERYDQSIGLLSAGVFYKRLTNPIFVRTLDNDIGGETSRPVNAESGEIVGFELAWQQRLTFLPGALSGLGIYANFTWTDSKATQPGGRETRLAGQSENAYNLALNYEKAGFTGQISLNHTGNYIDELGEDADDDLYADSRSQIDLSTAYFVTRSAQLYLEALNLGNAPYRTYQTSVDRVRQLEFYRPSVQLGVRFRP